MRQQLINLTRPLRRQLRTSRQSSAVPVLPTGFYSHVQIEKLASGMSHTTNFNHAFLEAGFVASEVVAHQLAIPGTEEVTRMLSGTARAEVI